MPVGAPDDPRIVEYARVADAVWLREHSLFVAEGRLVLERLIASGRFALRSVLVTPAALRAVDLRTVHVPVYVAEQPILNTVAGFNFHRGCLALAYRPETPDPDEVTASRVTLALEGIGNPDNVGGLFRVAAAFGAGGVLLDGTSGDPLYRKAVRTSMGTVFTLPFVRCDDWLARVHAARTRGARVVALTPRAEAIAVKDAPVSARDRLVLMVGAEGAGLSDAAFAAADVLVRIPMAPGVDSLNVTVAAGVALSHLA